MHLHWCNIVRRAADGLLLLPGALDKHTKTKVPDFDVHVHVKEKVAKLEVAVDNLVGVHVVAGADKLNHEKLGPWFCEDTMQWSMFMRELPRQSSSAQGSCRCSLHP
jgi:hypothetical protein